MNILKIDLSGELRLEDWRLFGGSFSFFEKIKMGGTGSGKLIYRGGIEHFDKIEDFTPTENSYLSFELFKKGLIIRINRTQRLRAVGLLFKNIVSLELSGHKVAQIHNKLSGGTKIAYQGELKITSNSGEIIDIEVPSREYENTIRFFEKPILKEKFRHSVK